MPQSMGLQRARHNLVTGQQKLIYGIQNQKSGGLMSKG